MNNPNDKNINHETKRGLLKEGTEHQRNALREIIRKGKEAAQKFKENQNRKQGK